MEHEAEIRKITGQHDLEKMVDWMYRWWGMQENYEWDAIKCYMMHSFQANKLPQTYGPAAIRSDCPAISRREIRRTCICCMFTPRLRLPISCHALRTLA